MWDSRGGAENDGGSRAGAGSRHDRARLDAGDNRGGPPSALSGEGSGSGVGARTWEANVMVLAATNAPEAVDTAFLRPGRFDEVCFREGLLLRITLAGPGNFCLCCMLRQPPSHRERRACRDRGSIRCTRLCMGADIITPLYALTIKYPGFRVDSSCI